MLDSIHNEKTGEAISITHGEMSDVLDGDLSVAIIDAYFALLNKCPSLSKYRTDRTWKSPSHFLSLSVLGDYDRYLAFLKAYELRGTDYIEEQARLYLPAAVATGYVLVVIDLRKHYIRVYDSVKERTQRHVLRKAVALVVMLKRISKDRYEVSYCMQFNNSRSVENDAKRTNFLLF